MKPIFFLLFFLQGMLINFVPAHAQKVLDQNYSAGSSGGPVINSTQSIGQTFTVGTTGSLVEIGLQIRKNPNVMSDGQLSLFTTQNNLPDMLLGTVPVPAATVPVSITPGNEFVLVNVQSLGIEVIAGVQLALTVSNPAATDFSTSYIWLRSPEGYSGGRSIVYISGLMDEWGPVQPAGDQGFQTFISIPEPNCFILLVATILLVSQKRCLILNK